MNKTNATESISISNWSSTEISYQDQRNAMLEKLTSAEVIGAPFVRADRQTLTTSLTRVHLFEKILSIQGAIVECGVLKAKLTFSVLPFIRHTRAL